MLNKGQKFKVVEEYKISPWFDDSGEEESIKGETLTVHIPGEYMTFFEIDGEESFGIALSTRDFKDAVKKGIIKELL